MTGGRGARGVGGSSEEAMQITEPIKYKDETHRAKVVGQAGVPGGDGIGYPELRETMLYITRLVYRRSRKNCGEQIRRLITVFT